MVVAPEPVDRVTDHQFRSCGSQHAGDVSPLSRALASHQEVAFFDLEVCTSQPDNTGETRAQAGRLAVPPWSRAKGPTPKRAAPKIRFPRPEPSANSLENTTASALFRLSLR